MALSLKNGGRGVGPLELELAGGHVIWFTPFFLALSLLILVYAAF